MTMKKISILVLGLTMLSGAVTLSYSQKNKPPKTGTSVMNKVKEIKTNDDAKGCKGEIWISNGNGYPGKNCRADAKCCETAMRIRVEGDIPKDRGNKSQ